MEKETLSRRRFCQIAGSSALLAPAFLRAQSSSKLTAREVLRRMQANVGVPWRTPTADEFKVGDPDAPITGITTTFMSTLDLIKRSAAAGNNFVISHEPTFWSANDEVATLREDPLYKYKLDFIKKNKMVVFRFHDHWHAHHPDGIFLGFNKTMGWEKYADTNGSPMAHTYTLPETTLEELARDLATKLQVRSVRVVGDPKMRVSRVGDAGHYIGQCMQLLPKVDVVLTFECREWEGAEYVKDAIAAGMPKAYIQLPHEGGEEAGMEECARWLSGFVTEVPVRFMRSGDQFWIPA